MLAASSSCARLQSALAAQWSKRGFGQPPLRPRKPRPLSPCGGFASCHTTLQLGPSEAAAATNSLSDEWRAGAITSLSRRA